MIWVDSTKIYRADFAGPQVQSPPEVGRLRVANNRGSYPPLLIMSKNSWLFFVAFIFFSINSIDSISSMLYMN